MLEPCSDWELLGPPHSYDQSETAQLYVLDPVTLTFIKYYEELFAISPRHKPLVWGNHVRFLFPSLLAMSDIFTAYQVAGQLNRIRRVKVFAKRINALEPTDSSWMVYLYLDTILDFFSDLKLDHLEYECDLPLLYKDFVHSPLVNVYEDVFNTLESSGWKRLTILGLQHHFDSRNIDQLIVKFRNLTRTDPADEYNFDLPDTPTIKNGSKIAGLDLERRQRNAEQLYWADTAADVDLVPSWLGGGFLAPQIVVVRKRHGIRRPYADDDVRNFKRKWLQDNGWIWGRFRKGKIT